MQHAAFSHLHFSERGHGGQTFLPTLTEKRVVQRINSEFFVLCHAFTATSIQLPVQNQIFAAEWFTHHSKQHSTPIVELKFLGRVVFSVGNHQDFHSHNGENLMQSLEILNTERKFAMLVPNCCQFQKLLFFECAALVIIQRQPCSKNSLLQIVNC